eukprot:gb/GECG01010199.1/.p1 GENE.gb/GECG01010199.1/~~gb/GECG01010199.1/.p1  ORF type:complete len:280 (+),score=60.46 gb/GECG01010199.1/:1-840(+)
MSQIAITSIVCCISIVCMNGSRYKRRKESGMHKTTSSTKTVVGSKRRRDPTGRHKHDTASENVFSVADMSLVDTCGEMLHEIVREQVQKRRKEGSAASSHEAVNKVLETKLEEFAGNIVDALRNHVIEDNGVEDEDDNESESSELEDEVERLRQQVDDLEGQVKTARKNVPRKIRQQGENAIEERKKQLLEMVNKDKENQEKEVEAEVESAEEKLKETLESHQSAIAEFERTCKQSSKKFKEVGSKLKHQLEQSKSTLRVMETQENAPTPSVEKTMKRR